MGMESNVCFSSGSGLGPGSIQVRSFFIAYIKPNINRTFTLVVPPTIARSHLPSDWTLNLGSKLGRFRSSCSLTTLVRFIAHRSLSQRVRQSLQNTNKVAVWVFSIFYYHFHIMVFSLCSTGCRDRDSEWHVQSTVQWDYIQYSTDNAERTSHELDTSSELSVARTTSCRPDAHGELHSEPDDCQQLLETATSACCCLSSPTMSTTAVAYSPIDRCAPVNNACHTTALTDD